MSPYFPPTYRRLCCVILPALLFCVTCIQSHATPIFEPVQGFVRSPKNPKGKLIQGSDGNFYGTTEYGGNGDGTIFKITPSGTPTTLVNFDFNTNGANPVGSLIQGSDGNFYGTTSKGGGDGKGTVFKITPSGTLTTLFVFSGGPGQFPYAGLILGGDGNFYGTTYAGGGYGKGTVFKMTPSGTVTPLLVNFSGANGSNPSATLVQGSDGNFYGTTRNGGGSNKGTVFRMSPFGSLTTLVNFNGTNGQYPYADLIQGNDGNFYGTTSEGGSNSGGTVFKMTPSGTLTTLVNFYSFAFGHPHSGLVQGSDGNFYGTTYDGTVFKMTPSGTLTTLVTFSGYNGNFPEAGLVQGSDGNFYGTAYSGGSGSGGTPNFDRGTVFKITPSGTLTTLVSFHDSKGSYPRSGLIQGSDGNFYGTTYEGGAGDRGTVFKMTPSGSLTSLVNFPTTAQGTNPYAGLCQGSDGKFYGTTGGEGTIFKMTSSGALSTLVNYNFINGGHPYAGLIQGSDGNYYGTTNNGSMDGVYGTIFKMTSSGTLTTLVNFSDATHGSHPYAGLLQGSDGSFYGTTRDGGSNDYGTVFKMTPSGTLTILVNFDGANGKYPYAGLIQGSDGSFYGTTNSGGGHDKGTVFKMTASGTLTTLVDFDYDIGSYPYSSLLQGTDGNFYGTTYQGGSGGIGGSGGKGTIFRMTPTGALTTLVNFNGTNGQFPYANLVRGSDGFLYGTTNQGGTTSDGLPAGGGQIFRLRMGPSLTSQPQTNVTSTGAILKASVDPGGYATPVSFQYGTDPSLASFSTVSAGTLSADTMDTVVQTAISGLQPGSTYYFRAVASNAENTVPQYGSILSFATPLTVPDIALEAPTGTTVTNGTGTLAFGSIAVDKRLGIGVTLRNTGNATLTSISASITGLDASQFTLLASPPATLTASESSTFTVRFWPTSLGSKTATLSIASNDPDESPFTLALTGSGVTPPEAWRYKYFQTNANAGDAADNADPDHDGLVNVLERAFNLNPTQPGQSVLAADTGTTGLPLIRRMDSPPRTSIQYIRLKSSANSGLTYTPQLSSALAGANTWSVASGTETVQSIDTEWERVTVEEDASSRSRRFGRVKVISSP